MWTTTTRTMILAAAVALMLIAVGCSGDPDEPATAQPPSPTPTEVPEQIVGIRGATGLGDPAFPMFGNGGYDISHYDLDLTVYPDANTLIAIADIQLTATANLLAFNFDFAGPEISEILVNGESAAFSRDENELTIETPDVIRDGSEFTVRVEYGGTPKPFYFPGFPVMGWTRTLLRHSIVVHGFSYALIPGNQTQLDKATYTLKVTAPHPFVVSASGTLTSTVDHGDTATFTWDVPWPVGGIHFVVSESTIESVPGPNGISINNYFPDDVSDATKKEFDIIAEVIELFSDKFGPYPYDSFGITYLPEFVDFSAFAITGGALVHRVDSRTIAHEIAHQWYGHSVSWAGFSDNWLNEGFATYGELLWVEHVDGVDAASHAAEALRTAIGPTTRPPAIVKTSKDVRDGSAYARGGLTLHALRSELGDDDFFDVMRTYSERFKYGAASTADFIAVAEEVSQQDLAEFFDGWVYSEAVPALTP